uniref:Uncharacterized protein n=1 Tax=Caudovirales sp. ctTVN2 TaxID=2827634 RepID=A0A8S5S884_9CAUD|nr:MAG TPA: hypothetical protein [Caudovirales sp. ctTVN2]
MKASLHQCSDCHQITERRIIKRCRPQPVVFGLRAAVLLAECRRPDLIPAGLIVCIPTLKAPLDAVNQLPPQVTSAVVVLHEVVQSVLASHSADALILVYKKTALITQDGSIGDVHTPVNSDEAGPTAGDKAFMLHRLDLLFLLGEHTGQLGVVLIGQFAGGVENIDLLRQTIGTAALDHAFAGAIQNHFRCFAHCLFLLSGVLSVIRIGDIQLQKGQAISLIHVHLVGILDGSFRLHNPATNVGRLQNDALCIIQRLPTKQVVRSAGIRNARSIRLRADDITAVVGFFDVGHVLGQGKDGAITGFDDFEQGTLPPKIA